MASPVVGATARGWKRAAAAVVVVLTTAALAGCIEVPVANQASTTEPDLPPEQELAALADIPAAELQTFGEDVLAFLADNRNTYCAITTEQGGIINSPVDPRLSGGQRDDTVLEVPAVYCELVRYPEPAVIHDDCHGTGLGFKGGTVLLTSEGALYGGCRIGMTLMEASFAPGTDSADSSLARLPVLEEGTAVELNGFRCGVLDRGVACLEEESRQGFLVSAEAFKNLTP